MDADVLPQGRARSAEGRSARPRRACCCADGHRWLSMAGYKPRPQARRLPIFRIALGVILGLYAGLAFVSLERSGGLCTFLPLRGCKRPVSAASSEDRATSVQQAVRSAIARQHPAPDAVYLDETDLGPPGLSASMLPPAYPHKGERLLFMLSSFDRGQRLAGNWEKGRDKIDIILKVVDVARQLCEEGYDVTFYMISAWPSSEERDAFETHLGCRRTGQQVPLYFWDSFNHTIGGRLAQQHRWVVMRELEKYDFFISIEDDTMLRPDMVEAFRRHSRFIREQGDARLARRFFPGFVRYEKNPRWANGSHCLWEGREKDFEVERIGDAWYAKTKGFSNQAMWMASREQVLWLNASCNEPFFPPTGPGWVEYWSGGLQIFEQCDMRKVLPLDEFETFTVFHAANNKLYHRGNSVTQVTDVWKRLMLLRDQCIKEGVRDSNMLRAAVREALGIEPK